MASEVWLRQAYAREGETRTPFLYEMVGPNDHRTTKLSRWIRAQTNGGVPRAVPMGRSCPRAEEELGTPRRRRMFRGEIRG